MARSSTSTFQIRAVDFRMTQHGLRSQPRICSELREFCDRKMRDRKLHPRITTTVSLCRSDLRFHFHQSGNQLLVSVFLSPIFLSHVAPHHQTLTENPRETTRNEWLAVRASPAVCTLQRRRRWRLSLPTTFDRSRAKRLCFSYSYSALAVLVLVVVLVASMAASSTRRSTVLLSTSTNENSICG